MARNAIIVPFCILVIVGIGVGRCEELHDLLTDEEIFRVFRTTRDNVPEYEVVPIMHNLKGRSPRSLDLEFTAFSRDLNMRFNPSDGVLAGENTPVWAARTARDGSLEYKRLSSDIVKRAAKRFTNYGTLSALLVDDSSSRRPRFAGTIGDLNIAVWPDRLQDAASEKFKQSKRRQGPSSSRNLIPTDYHVVFKSDSSSGGEIALKSHQLDGIMGRVNGTQGHRMKREPVADIIYPTIMIVTDYSSTRMLDDESWLYGDIHYQLAFWNSVDVRFRNLTEPKVRLRIGGIIIGVGGAATPYINNNIYDYVPVIKPERKLNSPYALVEGLQYWYNLTSNPDFATDAYNAVITLTDSTVNVIKESEGTAQGISFPGTFCKSQPQFSKYLSFGIVHDDGNYGGIVSAAQTLGHLFGASYELDSEGECAFWHGYIMSRRVAKMTPMNTWSPCSVEKIRNFFSMDNHRDCANQPLEKHNPGEPIGRFVGGDYKSHKEQCIAQGYVDACDPEPKMCKRMVCWEGGVFVWGQDVSYSSCSEAPNGAIDGTRCQAGTLAQCIGGECVMLDLDVEE